MILPVITNAFAGGDLGTPMESFQMIETMVDMPLNFAKLVRNSEPTALNATRWKDAGELLRQECTDLPTPADNTGPWFGTVGDPKLRFRPRDIDTFSAARVKRRWRSGINRLHKVNPLVVGFCVVELQLCRALERTECGTRYFFEPHFHFVIYGVTLAQVRQAFRFRKNSSATIRKRPLKLQAVYDLNGAIGYMTKGRPEYRLQWRNGLKSGWRRSRLPESHRLKWQQAMLHCRVGEMLSTTGFSIRKLQL